MENIVITGVSTGIGYNLAKAFIDGGFKVFGSVRKREDGERLKKDFGAPFHPLLFDVTDHEAVQASVDEVKSVIGERGLGGLINNSGIAVGGPVMHTSLDDYQRQFDVNLFGVIAVTKAYLPLLGAMKDYTRKPGKIINISSVSGKIAFPFLSPYCASKFALEAFSESLRREMLLYGIDVILIGPGPIKTPIWKKSTGASKEVLESDFGPSLEKFYQQMEKSIKDAMEPDKLARQIFKVFAERKPKTRYTFLNNKFKTYTIPRYIISPRKFDGIIKKMFFQQKP
jgi:NAD(P)-dependent dehydrogenase (short-subunit alcohol dehydrogenase family)